MLSLAPNRRDSLCLDQTRPAEPSVLVQNRQRTCEELELCIKPPQPLHKTIKPPRSRTFSPERLNSGPEGQRLRPSPVSVSEKDIISPPETAQQGHSETPPLASLMQASCAAVAGGLRLLRALLTCAFSWCVCPPRGSQSCCL